MKKILAFSITGLIILFSELSVFLVYAFPADSLANDARQLANEVAEEKQWEKQRQKILADGYLKEGIRHYSDRQYDLALKEFIESYNIDPANEEVKSYIDKVEFALADAEKGLERRRLAEEKRRISMLIRSSANNIREYRPDQSIMDMKEAEAIDPNSRRVDYFFKAAREAEIQKVMDRLQNETDIRNKDRLTDVYKAWTDPTIPTTKDRYYYREKKNLLRNPLEAKTDVIIPIIEFNEAQLKDVLKYLSETSGVNIVIDDKAVTPVDTVTVYLKDTSLLDSLKIILQSKKLVYRFENDIIWVTSKDRLQSEDMIVKVYDVQDLLGKMYDFPAVPLGESLKIDKSGEKDKDKKDATKK